MRRNQTDYEKSEAKKDVYGDRGTSYYFWYDYDMV